MIIDSSAKCLYLSERDRDSIFPYDRHHDKNKKDRQCNHDKLFNI